MEEEGRPHHGMRLNLEALSHAQLEAAALEAGVPLAEVLPPDFKMRKRRHRTQSVSGTLNDVERTPSGTCNSSRLGLDANEPRSSNTFHPDSATLMDARLGSMIAVPGILTVNVQGASDDCDPRLPSAGLTGAQLGHHDDDVSSQRSTHAEAITNLPPVGESLQCKTRLKLVDGYETFRSNMEREERRAYYARLVVAWTLFIIFWTVNLFISSSVRELTLPIDWGFDLQQDRELELWDCHVFLYVPFLSRHLLAGVNFTSFSGFIAFTTIGFGDITPTNPAGRSVFVVWALLGVGTMTILISGKLPRLFKIHRDLPSGRQSYLRVFRRATSP